MAQQFFGGTIQTLSNLIQQEKRQRFLKQSPQYQQALFNLMQAKEQAARLGAFREQIASGQLTPTQIAQQGATFAAGEGQLEPAVTLAQQEATTQRIPVASKEQRKAAVPGVVETFETGPDGLTSEDINYWVEKGTLPEEAYPRLRVRQRPNQFDPYTRALMTTLGSGAGKAQISLKNVGAITGDVVDTLNNFLKIPADLRGPVAGRTTGQIAKLGQQDVVSYEDTKQLMIANIAKQLGGEVGVLTDRDISRIERSLPQLRDSDETAYKKIKFVMNYIDRRVRAKQATGGLPVTGIEMPTQFRDFNFDPDKVTVNDYVKKIPVVGEQLVPQLPRTGQQQQAPAPQAAPQGDEVDSYLNNLGL